MGGHIDEAMPPRPGEGDDDANGILRSSSRRRGPSIVSSSSSSTTAGALTSPPSSSLSSHNLQQKGKGTHPQQWLVWGQLINENVSLAYGSRPLNSNGTAHDLFASLSFSLFHVPTSDDIGFSMHMLLGIMNVLICIYLCVAGIPPALLSSSHCRAEE